MKIVQTDNIAAHYRASIYVKMAKELGCDVFIFCCDLYSPASTAAMYGGTVRL